MGTCAIYELMDQLSDLWLEPSAVVGDVKAKVFELPSTV
jgi:hypothetical protein